MRYCLCCSKEIDDNLLWHKNCIKNFFNTTTLPKLDINSLDFEKYITNKKSITGVQKKLSIGFGINNSKKVTIINYPKGYIIKTNTDKYKFIVEAEHLVMTMADITKIDVVNHGLLLSDDNKYIYITKRIDRDGYKKIHMEDFCQLSNRPTEYKYSSSCEACFRIIDKYSETKILDKVNLYERIIFSYITGNSDMHLKNYSLIYDDLIHLSKAYDLLPVNLILPNDKDETALTINGKKRNLTKNDFLSLGNYAEIGNKVCLKIIEKILNLKDKYFILIDNSLLPIEEKKNFKILIENRMNTFKN